MIEYKKFSECVKEGEFPPYFVKDCVSSIGNPIQYRSTSKLTWRCHNCGKEYSQTIQHHLNGSGCPFCSRKERMIKARETMRERNPIPQEVLDIAVGATKEKIINGSIKTLDKGNWYCSIHGQYTMVLYDILRGKRCPICSIRKGQIKKQQTQRSKNPLDESKLSDLYDKKDLVRINKGLNKNTKVRFICPKHGIYWQRWSDHYYHGNKCQDCANEINSYGSSWEVRIKEDLQKLGISSGKRNSLIKNPITGYGYELDLFLPDYNLAIEVDGLYYHSYEHIEEFTNSDPKNYHKIKTDLCEQKGIQLIHLFEDDLKRDYQLCFNLILSKIGKLHKKTIYARSCKIVEVSSEVARKFYDKYHIQGWGQGNVLGLEYKGHLVSCMSSRRGPSNTSSRGAYELNRYASINNYFVVGGFEKLMKAHEKKYQIKKWISYADRTVSDGSLYFRTGWTLEFISEPDYKYIYKGVRYHKFNFRIRRFREDPNLKYEEGLSEFQLARLNKITRIYDCGKMKFTKAVSI